MGLFDKLLGGQSSENATLTKQEAVAAVLLITVAADGNISSEEVESVIAISNRMQLLRSQTADQFNEMMRKLIGILQKQGYEFLLNKATEAMPADLKQTAFAVAADLMFADGFIEEKEKTVIEAIQRAMQIPDDLALKIVEVLQIKNRG
jgi:uncharacterized tellurite resistance protein B-like protein